MKIQYDTEKLASLQQTRQKYDDALSKFEDESKAYSTSIAALLVQSGLGKGAQIRHKHADAHFGNESQAIVVSEVINGFVRKHSGFKAAVRICLGKANGKGTTTSIASVEVDNILEVVTPSYIDYAQSY